MKVSLGDTLEIWLVGDDEPVTVCIRGFADTNFGQSVYLSVDYWESLHKGAFTPSALLLKAPTALALKKLEADDAFNGFKYPDEQGEQAKSILDSLSTVFSIMSGAALGLAFVICYSMGLMNFTERMRDYATLKVLGYHQREIRRLILRENNLTALLGVALGIPPGIWLTGAILDSCASETMVYASYVSPKSILIASVITFAFSWCVQRFLTRKVKKIDMVEALKSVE